jgi:hypothetical protein
MMLALRLVVWSLNARRAVQLPNAATS